MSLKFIVVPYTSTFYGNDLFSYLVAQIFIVNSIRQCFSFLSWIIWLNPINRESQIPDLPKTHRSLFYSTIMWQSLILVPTWNIKKHTRCKSEQRICCLCSVFPVLKIVFKVLHYFRFSGKSNLAVTWEKISVLFACFLCSRISFSSLQEKAEKNTSCHDEKIRRQSS